MRSCASFSSPTAHITFCTFTEVVRPQILIMRSLPLMSSIQPPRFLRQHDGYAVPDGIGELGGARDQLLLFRIIFQRTLGERADQNFQELRVDAAGRPLGR